MSQNSARLNLPYIQPAQAQKHVTHNEAIELLDMLVQLTLVDFDHDTPPVSPAEGDAWALGPAPTGAWGGHSGIATWRGSGWLFVTPQTGWQAYGITPAEVRTFDGTTWIAASGTVDLQNQPGLGINASYDATNKLTVSADATLLNNAGFGHQLKLNKATSGDTASLLYQSSFSGRAEMGLAGNDDFTIKVSDGASWFTGLTVLGTTGAVRIDQMLSLPGQIEPASGTAGDVYFDSTSNKLRCYDGTLWQDLF